MWILSIWILISVVHTCSYFTSALLILWTFCHFALSMQRSLWHLTASVWRGAQVSSYLGVGDCISLLCACLCPRVRCLLPCSLHMYFINQVPSLPLPSPLPPHPPPQFLMGHSYTTFSDFQRVKSVISCSVCAVCPAMQYLLFTIIVLFAVSCICVINVPPNQYLFYVTSKPYMFTVSCICISISCANIFQGPFPCLPFDSSPLFSHTDMDISEKMLACHMAILPEEQVHTRSSKTPTGLYSSYLITRLCMYRISYRLHQLMSQHTPSHPQAVQHLLSNHWGWHPACKPGTPLALWFVWHACCPALFWPAQIRLLLLYKCPLSSFELKGQVIVDWWEKACNPITHIQCCATSGDSVPCGLLTSYPTASHHHSRRL